MTALIKAYMALTAALPALVLRPVLRSHAAQGADPARIGERQGQPGLARPTGRIAWVHAASMGEVLAVGDLLADLRKARPDLHLLVTTTTATGGFAVTRAVPGALHQFLPADIPKAVAGFLDHWRPDAAIIVESDIWPRLVTVSSARSIPLALVNARPSRTRLRLPRSMGALLSRFSLVTTQDVKVTQEILSLGVSEESVVTAGDLKADAAVLPDDAAKRTALTRMIGDRSLWSAVSTHPADEGAVLAAHAALRQRRPDALLLLVPRHPARGEAIISACAAQGLSSARRSLGESVTTDTAVYLCDTVGETGVFFRLARIVFLGGSFGKEGGHNPFEPLSLGAAVLHGPRVRHFSASYARFDAAGASKVVADATALESAVDAWLRDPAHLDRAVAAGRCSLTEMPGAREITLTSLLALLDRHA
jgi:3-deoxy-D-manno-octulosonic-acid transferase